MSYGMTDELHEAWRYPKTAIGIQHHGINGVLITYIGDPPLPCVSVLAANPDKASELADRAREILMLLRK